MVTEFVYTIEGRKIKIPPQLDISNKYWCTSKREATEEEIIKCKTKYVLTLELVEICKIIPSEKLVGYHQRLQTFLYEVQFANGTKTVVEQEELFYSKEQFTQLTGIKV